MFASWFLVGLETVVPVVGLETVCVLFLVGLETVVTVVGLETVCALFGNYHCFGRLLELNNFNTNMKQYRNTWINKRININIRNIGIWYSNSAWIWLPCQNIIISPTPSSATPLVETKI